MWIVMPGYQLNSHCKIHITNFELWMQSEAVYPLDLHWKTKQPKNKTKYKQTNKTTHIK